MNFTEYSTLKVSLLPKTRTLKIALNRPEHDNSINSLMLEELNQILTWSFSHTEIKTLLFTSTSSIFSTGIDFEEMAKGGNQILFEAFESLYKVTQILLYLPQTVIFDLKMGASGAALEFSLGGDFRFAHKESILSFNHIDQATIPASTGIVLAGELFGQAKSRQFYMSPKNISSIDRTTSSLISEEYYDNDDRCINRELENQAALNNLTRVQLKRSLLEPIREKIEAATKWESSIARAGMCDEEWKNNYIKNEEESSNVVQLRFNAH